MCLLNGTDVRRRLTHPLKVLMERESHVQTQGFVFGTMALRSFYVALTVTAGRVGLAQRAGKVGVEETIEPERADGELQAGAAVSEGTDVSSRVEYVSGAELRRLLFHVAERGQA